MVVVLLVVRSRGYSLLFAVLLLQQYYLLVLCLLTWSTDIVMVQHLVFLVPVPNLLSSPTQ